MNAVHRMVLAALALLAAAASLQSEEQSPDAVKQGLRGPVRFVRVERAEYFDRGGQRLRRVPEGVSETRFNEAGNVTETHVHGTPGTRTTSVYDDAGRLVSRQQYRGSRLTAASGWTFSPEGLSHTEIWYADDGAVRRRIERRFDAAGKKLSEMEYNEKDRIVRRWQREPLGTGSWIRLIPAFGVEELTYFDSQGRMTAMRKGSGTSLQRWTYGYDDGGRLAEARYTDRNGSDLYTFGHDGTGALSEVLRSSASGRPVYRRRYAYSAAGSQETETVTWFDSEGQPERTWVKRFDAAGNLLAKEYRHERQPFSCRWTYGYDAAGRLTLEAFHDSRGRVFSLTETAWDAQGNKLSERSSGRGVDPGLQVLNEYDTRGRLLETVRQDLEGRLLSRETRRYNEWGDPVETARFNPDGSLASSTRYDYVHDQRGNWTERVTLLTDNAKESYGLPTEYQRRSIEYYP